MPLAPGASVWAVPEQKTHHVFNVILQGEYCFVLEATANIDTSQITNDLGQSLTDWAADNSLKLKSQARASKRMCFYKLLQKTPAANVTYSMCRTGRCESIANAMVMGVCLYYMQGHE